MRNLPNDIGRDEERDHPSEFQIPWLRVEGDRRDGELSVQFEDGSALSLVKWSGLDPDLPTTFLEVRMDGVEPGERKTELPAGFEGSFTGIRVSLENGKGELTFKRLDER